MATIGEEIAIDTGTIITNVIDATTAFDNTSNPGSYADGISLQHDDGLYINASGSPIPVTTFSAVDEETYADGEIVYKDGYITVADESGTKLVPKQPEEYTGGSDVGVVYDNWTKRYVKVVDFPLGFEADSFSHGYANVYAFAMSRNGNKMYISESSTSNVREYSLATSFKVSTATLVNTKAMGYNCSALFFREDGLRMYTIDSNGASDSIMKAYTLTVAFDISTAGSPTATKTLTGVQSGGGLTFNDAGTKCYYTDYFYTSNKTIEATLSTAWDISTLSVTRTITDIADSYCTACHISQDGHYFYQLFNDTYGWLKYYLPTAFSLLGRVLQSAKSAYGPGGGIISSTGEYMYTLGSSTITRYAMNTPFDITYAISSKTAKLNVYTYDATDNVLYQYYITTVGGTKFNFRALPIGSTYTVAKLEQTTDINEHTYIDENTIERSPYVYDYKYSGSSIAHRDWLARTVIQNDEGIFIRSWVDVAQEKKTVPSFTYDIATSPLDIGFTYYGKTNPLKPFDGSNVISATHDGSVSNMEYTVESLGEFNSFTLAKVLASSITYNFTLPVGHSDYDLWLNGVPVVSGGNGIVETDTLAIDCKRDPSGVLSYYPTTLIFYSGVQLPIGSTVDISLSYSGTIRLGDFTLNNSIAYSMTNNSFSHAIQDWNDYTPDAWGNIPAATKAKVTKFNITMDVLLTNYDYAVSFHESIAGKNVCIDGSDSNGQTPDGENIFGSMIRRVRVTSVTSNSVVKDGDIYKLAGVTMSVQEIV